MTKPVLFLCLDFETHWCSKTYTLRKMSTTAYITDPRFRVHGASMRVNGGPAKWITRDQLPRVLAGVPWERTALVAFNCVDGETEVLTPAGWVAFTDYTDGTEVAQFNDGEVTFVTPTATHRHTYTGPMYSDDGVYHQGMYTPNHRMVVYKKVRPPETATELQFLEAETVASRHPNSIHFACSGIMLGGDASFNPTEIRLLEAVRADGSMQPRGNQISLSLEKPRKIERLRALAGALGVPLHYRASQKGRYGVCVLADCELVRRIRAWLTPGKVLGSRVLALPVEVREAWLDEARYWDGAATLGYPGVALSTARKDHADWFQAMAVCTGCRVRVETIHNQHEFGVNNPHALLYLVSYRAKRPWNKLIRQMKPVPFNGTVYCLTVPSGAFIVRRRGATWVTGNSAFDASALAWHYGHRPKLDIDVMGMARAVLGNTLPRFNLDTVAKHFGLEGKRHVSSFRLTDGVEVLPPHVERELAIYCNDDVDMTWELFQRLKRDFPARQYKALDWTIKMMTNPTLMLDEPVLRAAHVAEVARKEAVIESLGVELSDLRSNDKFAALLAEKLEPYDDAVPMKLSARTGKETYAFSQQDEEFIDLKDHPDEEVAALVEARLNVKGSLAETRALSMAELTSKLDGYMPVGLNYSGAVTTHRLSGNNNGVPNIQNLSRGSQLRAGIIAPPDHKIVAIDLSQIELRIGAMLVGQMDIVEQLRTGGDTYSTFAANVYGRLIDKNVDKEERQVGKVTTLSCIASGKRVLTSSGIKAIQDVATDDLVWDGVEFVAHSGVVYRGYKKVIWRGNLSATPDHRVLLHSGDWAEIGVTPERDIARCPRRNVWEVDSPAVPGDADTVRLRVRSRGYGEHAKLGARANVSVPSMRSSAAIRPGALSTLEPSHAGDAAAVLGAYQSRVSALRGAGDRVSLRVSAGSYAVDRREPARMAGGRDRQDRQQRPLRTRKLAPRYSGRAERQQGTECLHHVARAEAIGVHLGREPFRAEHYRAVRGSGLDGGADRRAGVGSRDRQAQELAGDRGQATGYEGGAPSDDVSSRRYEWGRYGAEIGRLVRRVERVSGLGTHMERAPVLAPQNAGAGGARTDGRADHSTSAVGCAGEVSGVAERPAPDAEEWAHVYDILNCGPRNQFACEGYIVHNCQYVAGAGALRRMLMVQAKLRRDMAFCIEVINTYRRVYANYPEAWKRLKLLLAIWARGDEWDPQEHLLNWPDAVVVERGRIILPSGLSLKYPDVRQEYVYNKFTDKKELQYTFASQNRMKSFVADDGTRRQKVYSGVVIENSCQSLAREVMDTVAELIASVTRLWPAMQVHDELVYSVPETDAEDFLDTAMEIIHAPLSWWPTLPVAAEGGLGVNYLQIEKKKWSRA